MQRSQPEITWHPRRTSPTDRAGIITGAVTGLTCLVLLTWALILVP